MRRSGTLLVALWTLCVVGCLTNSTTQPTGWLDRLQPWRGLASANVIQMDVAILEATPGDHFLNEGLWEQADEQVVSLDRKATVDDNGFRVGQIGEVMPVRLQALLNSPHSCVVQRRHQVRAGDPITVVLGPNMVSCGFDLHQDGHTSQIDLADAQCSFRIVANVMHDGSTRLHFTPLVQHGAKRAVLHSSAEHDTVFFDQQRPTEEYRNLGWDVTLAPNQFVVVGAHLERSKTLGYHCFYRPDETKPVQRLLVIWPGHAPASTRTTTALGETAPHGVPTIAEQAASTTARGQAP